MSSRSHLQGKHVYSENSACLVDIERALQNLYAACSLAGVGRPEKATRFCDFMFLPGRSLYAKNLSTEIFRYGHYRPILFTIALLVDMVG